MKSINAIIRQNNLLKINVLSLFFTKYLHKTIDKKANLFIIIFGIQSEKGGFTLVITTATTTTKIATIRNAELKDASKIQEIYMPYILETVFNLDTIVPSIETLENRITQVTENYPFLVAEADNEVIGFVYVNHFYDYGFNNACMLSIYVSDKTSIRGVGKLMYDHMEALLISSGLRYIISSIVETNIKSLKFHKKQNFEEFVRLPNIASKHDQFQSIVWMAKNIAPALEYIYLT